MKNQFYKLFAMLLLLLVSSKVYSQDPCLILAKYGTYDTRTTAYSRERAISYLSLFKRETQMTYQEANNYSASLGIPIGDVIASFSGSSDTEKYQNFVQKINSSTDFDESDILKVQTVERTINKDVMATIQTCLTSDGIHAYITSTNDPNLYFLHVEYTSRVTAYAVNLKLQWTSSINSPITINGKKYDNSFPIKLKQGASIDLTIGRFNNASIIFTLNQVFNPIIPQKPVKMQQGNIAIYSIAKKITTSTPPPPQVIDVIVNVPLEMANATEKIGNGDEELKGPSGTVLDGNFKLDYDEYKITAVLDAFIYEPKPDWTRFRTLHTYNIYSAPKGFKIIGAAPADNSGTSSHFNNIQGGFGGQTFAIGTGPLASIFWIGDTGSARDSVTGCQITPKMKDIKVRLVKIIN